MGAFPGSIHPLPALLEAFPGGAGGWLPVEGVGGHGGLVLLLGLLGLSLALDRRARLRALRRSESQLKGFIRHAPAAIAFKDRQGRFLLLNARMEAKIGLPAEEILGKANESLFSEEVCAPLRDRDAQVLAGGQAIQVEERWPSRVDGTPRDYLSQKFPLLDERGVCWGLGLIDTDITERLQSEGALQQSRKLESMGLLAGGVAHDFNNLLAAMRGHLHGAQGEAPPRALGSHLEALEELVESASRLLNQLLLFAGRGGAPMGTLDLNRALSGLVQLLRASLPRGVSIRLDLHPGPLAMTADASQIQQVLLNMLINAAEALREGAGEGVITLRTARELLSEAAIRSSYPGQGLRPGCHVALDVADNGPGMTPEVLGRIFDPFFTTKATGRGLGLSAIRGIVRSHHGGIQVESTPGLGTLFRLRFPCEGEGGAAGPPWPNGLGAQGRPPDSVTGGAGASFRALPAPAPSFPGPFGSSPCGPRGSRWPGW